jgi:DNA-binding IclR family transcriptional regulator
VPRSSPQTLRVVAVVELLTGLDEGGGATMTEIARALDLNQATCVHMLAALTTAGFVVREPGDRRYHLGPALAEPGRRAASRYPRLAAARVEMAALSEEFGLPCVAFAREADHARLVQHTWPQGQPPLAVKVGETVPLTPPLGLVFVAWGDDEGFEAWLRLSPEAGTGTGAGAEADHLRSQRAAVRRLGFVAEMAPPEDDRHRLAGVIVDRASPYRDRQLHDLLTGRGELVLTDLGGDAPWPVTSIGAPVLDPAGVVVMSLSLVTFVEGPLPGRRIGVIGEAVAAASSRLSAALASGQRPDGAR